MSLQVYAELLASVMFAFVAYQDFKERMVSDWVWLLAIVAGVVMLIERPDMQFASISKIIILAIIGGICFLRGFFGQADCIVLIPMAIGTSFWSPLPQFLAGSLIGMVHIVYLVIRNRSINFVKVMPVEEAINQSMWIPREVSYDGTIMDLEGSPEEVWDKLKGYIGKNATVTLTYGAPLAGYLAIGYILATVLLILGFI